MYLYLEYIWSIVLFIFTIWTVIGNILVIVAVLKYDELHEPRHYLTLSLAITDLMVGLVTMPVTAIIKPYKPGGWIYGVFLCESYLYLTITMSQASMFNLVVIAWDRYCSLTDANYFQKRTNKRIFIMILVVWILACINATPLFFLGDDNYRSRIVTKNHCMFHQNLPFAYSTNIPGFWIPLLILAYLYICIYRVCLD